MKKQAHLYPVSHIAQRGFFYAGGELKTTLDGEHYYLGQMYVEVYIPINVTKKYPIIMIHGKGKTNVNWYGTADGKEGWLDFFLKQGYVVYLAEQPARGRSPWYETDDNFTFWTVERGTDRFIGKSKKWPQGILHTRWPEAAEPGKEDFVQYMKSEVPFLKDDKLANKVICDSMEEVFEFTGPAILLGHSQGCRFIWSIADRYAEQTVGIICVEPNGPTFSNNPEMKTANCYGITDEPLTFDPPIKNLEELKIQWVPSDKEGLDAGFLQAEPARKLPRLMGKPLLIVTGEASIHAKYDYLCSKFLTQAGVKHDYYVLADMGIHGNGHMIMLEDNALEVAGLIAEWLDKAGL